jgi:hypothetical protein
MFGKEGYERCACQQKGREREREREREVEKKNLDKGTFGLLPFGSFAGKKRGGPMTMVRGLR